MFNIQKIKDNISSMGIKVYLKNFVSSTNDFVKYKYIRDQAPIVVLTNNQRRPRGRRGALWVNYNLHSFSFTFCVKLNQKVINNQYMSQIVGISVIEACEKYNIEDLSLKHPNDILKNKNKVGGILIENIIFNPDEIYSAIGIGLNITLPEKLLLSIEGKPGNLDIDREQVNDLVPEILKRIIKNLNSLGADERRSIDKINQFISSSNV